MRLRVAFLTLALGVAVTGNARAYDATGIIYDLSTPGTQKAMKPDDKGPAKHEGTDVETPHDQRDWGHEHGRDQDQDHGRGRGHHHDHERGPGHGRDHDGDENPPGNGREGNPSPTPEPGTMLLLGGGLAAGIRRFRKR